MVPTTTAQVVLWYPRTAPTSGRQAKHGRTLSIKVGISQIPQALGYEAQRSCGPLRQ